MITHQEKLERIKYLRELINSLSKELPQDLTQNPNINSLEVLQDINLQKQLTKNSYQIQLTYLLKTLNTPL